MVQSVGLPAVKSAAAVASNMDMSLLSLISRADIVVQMVMLILFICSIWCWAIVFEKIFKYRAAKIKANNFEKRFWSGQILDQFYHKTKSRANHALAIIFCSAMEEWEKNNFENVKNSQEIKQAIMQRVSKTVNISINKESDKLETKLSVLASIGSYAPFIGLFGTVWGIMHSFQSIAASKNTSLAVVAPGIAEALLATAIGLFAAIPAVIFYNYLSGKLNNLRAIMSDFADELQILLSRELDQL